jgi:hypothetical protein
VRTAHHVMVGHAHPTIAELLPRDDKQVRTAHHVMVGHAHPTIAELLPRDDNGACD